MRATVTALLLLASCGGATGTATTEAPPTTTLLTTTTPEGSMQLTSSAFANENRIPSRYTCDGPGTSPPLEITGLPARTTHLVILMDDPDAPGGTWDHWVAYDVAVTSVIPEGNGVIGTTGVSTGGVRGYESPCPPSGSHRYFFNVIALDGPLGLPPGATKSAVLDAVAAAGTRVLAKATLLGRYSRS